MTLVTTSVPIPTLSPTGYTIPEENQILSGVQTDINNAFGGGLNSSLTTPQGQLASSMAAIISDCNSQFLNIVTQVDPQYAQGFMQDAIGSIYFQTRIPATSTTLSVVCQGLNGTVLAANTPLAVDGAGNLYECSGATIGSTNTTIIFNNVSTGPIAYTAPLNIYQTTPGWDSIVSVSTQALGLAIETQQAFEVRRQASVAGNAVGILQSMKAAVLSSGSSLNPPTVPVSAYLYENNTSVNVTFGGITLIPNSIYVAVKGGDSYSIANAIWTKKAPGCNYTPSAIFIGSSSTTTLTVTSISSGYIAPGQSLINSTSQQPYNVTILSQTSGTTGGVGVYVLSGNLTLSSSTIYSSTLYTIYDTTYPVGNQPSYNICYTVPQQIPIYIAVTLAAASNPPTNALTLLQNSIIGLNMAFLGTDGAASISNIGATIYASRFYTTISQILPTATILNVSIGTSASPTASQLAMNINQIPYLPSPLLTNEITLILA